MKHFKYFKYLKKNDNELNNYIHKIRNYTILTEDDINNIKLFCDNDKLIIIQTLNLVLEILIQNTLFYTNDI